MDSSGEPLSIGETLGNLERATEEIRRSSVFLGAEVRSVSAVIPSECNTTMQLLMLNGLKQQKYKTGTQK